MEYLCFMKQWNKQSGQKFSLKLALKYEIWWFYIALLKIYIAFEINMTIFIYPY